MKKKSKAGGFTLLIYKTYFKSSHDKVVLVKLQTYRSMDQKKSPEIDVTHMYDHVFDKGEKEIQQRKESFTNKWCWKN